MGTMMKPFVGKNIKIDRGGSESRVGKLLAAYDDYFILLTEDDGVVYYKSFHVKSLTDNVKEELNFSLEIPEGFEYKKGKNFEDLLKSLTFQWVKINRGGPEKLEGVLVNVNPECLSLINQEEIVHISMFHIRNISYGVKIEEVEEEKSQYQDEEFLDEKRDYDHELQREYRHRGYRERYYTEAENKPVREEQSRRTGSIRKTEKTQLNYRHSGASSKKTSMENDLSELLSSMEQFFRNHSRTNSEWK